MTPQEPVAAEIKPREPGPMTLGELLIQLQTLRIPGGDVDIPVYRDDEQYGDMEVSSVEVAAPKVVHGERLPARILIS